MPIDTMNHTSPGGDLQHEIPHEVIPPIVASTATLARGVCGIEAGIQDLRSRASETVMATPDGVRDALNGAISDLLTTSPAISRVASKAAQDARNEWFTSQDLEPSRRTILAFEKIIQKTLKH